MLFVLPLFAAVAVATPSTQITIAINDCSTTQVEPGDSCATLISRCGISSQDFTTFNPDPHLCSTLQPNQYVCCSAGSLPDRRPKPNPNGSCFTYTAKDQDTCSLIATANSLTVDQIEQVNTQTWGWDGCQNLQIGQTFCLSSGSPPMPAPVQGAICGPQVPGTQQPADMSQLASLNQCPLNVCCNKWGQCGTTSDFCVQTKSLTGNPGTSAPGTNGCISNCGMDIVNNKSPPPEFRRVGYFESWNTGRPCLNMDASQIDASQYDYVHFGFGEVTADFDVTVSDVQGQFDVFKKQSGFKKVISFGGWSFSTAEDSYPIFRQGVTDVSRALFAQKVVDFISNNNLDGVDFDWEYPGAPDIPGIPAGSPEDGANYLAFLKTLRSKLDPSKTISIAAPASYWYLKGFPIAEMSGVVDYIVFMTYDLHGQWDYGSKFAAQGCPGGSCLRSHVNYTETVSALSMVTKAGVPASKIVVGIGTYGRSFQMSVPGCDGPMCTFTGPAPGGRPGVCTQTAGYISNAEIVDILAKDPTAKTHYDQGSDSNILEYGGDQWVAYMDANTIKGRVYSYRALNFGGTVEWAIDLGKFYDPVPDGSSQVLLGGGCSAVAGHGLPLTPKSTCNDLESYAPSKGDLDCGMWIAANTDNYFSDWIRNPSRTETDFVFDFADPWGVGESFRAYAIDSMGGPPDCGVLGRSADASQSGPAYMVLMSIYNFLKSLSVIYEAVEFGKGQMNEVATLLQAFDTQTDVADPLAAREAILSIAAVIEILIAFAAPEAAVAAGVATAAVGGLTTGIITAFKDPSDDFVQTSKDFENFMNTTFDTLETSLSQTFTDFKLTGVSNDIALQDLFADGAWVNSGKNQLLNGQATTKQINDAFVRQMYAASISWAWRKQRVWLMSYPMTEDQFHTFYSNAGNNDANLKAYYDGRGYFLQSVSDQGNPFGVVGPIIKNPPAYDQLGAFSGFSTQEVVQSSANSFSKGGFKSDPTQGDLSSILTSQGGQDVLSSVFPAIFTIPVCALDNTYAWTPTLQDFADSLVEPGVFKGKQSRQAPYCYCIGVQDKYGVKFEDVVDVGKWSGRSDGYCASNLNTVGGRKPNLPDPPRSGGKPPPPQRKLSADL